ncbi:MAG: hypothetical protein NTX71_05920 [Candidatus Aureabacteria bacterium]|nr:hypothetical protein [Candidatus Auribacterota bacterium]
MGKWRRSREVDTYYEPVVMAHRLYAEAMQGSRDMRRVGMAV